MEFMDLFLKICECRHQQKCLADFEKLDISVRPQGGFLGSNYWKNRVLIVGQNPGGGKTARGNLGSEDDYYYRLVEGLVKTKSADRFEDLMKHLENEFMPRWAIFRNFDLKRHWRFGLPDIALINAVHCRTRGDEAPNARVARRCFSEHTIGQINILEPRLIICFGKKAYDFLDRLYPRPKIPIKYVLHPSGQYTKQHPDKQADLVKEIALFLADKTRDKPKYHKEESLTTGHEPWRSEGRTQKRRITSMDKDIIHTQKRLKEYLISKGFKEVPKSFFWSCEHPTLGKINYHNDGQTFGINLLSAEVRNNCGYTTAERQAMPKKEREEVYRGYLEKKPYYKNIKYGLKFYFKKTATDYIGLHFSIGFERLKQVIEDVWAGRSS